MNRGQFFSTLDISYAYLHMPMDEGNAMMQKLSIQKGLYKINRMMFDMNIVSAIWQRYMGKVLQGLMGVQMLQRQTEYL